MESAKVYFAVIVAIGILAVIITLIGYIYYRIKKPWGMRSYSDFTDNYFLPGISIFILKLYFFIGILYFLAVIIMKFL